MTFEQEIWLRLWNAVFTGLFVGVAAGLITWAVQRRGDSLLKDRERALEIEREARALRRDLVQRVSELNGGFYFTMQRYWRQKSSPDTWGAADGPSLDKSYITWAMTAEALERDVGTIFGWDSRPEILLHQSRDLLTVRYFGLRDRNTEELRRENAEGTDGKLHSGLSIEKLRGPKTVLSTFRACSKQLDRELLTAAFAEYATGTAAAGATAGRRRQKGSGSGSSSSS